VDGSRYGYMFGLVLVAIVLVFSFMLKGGKEEPKLVPVQVDGGAVESLAV
jgi:DHA2 family lincomycin resistance protein-like MFS transporter